MIDKKLNTKVTNLLSIQDMSRNDLNINFKKWTKAGAGKVFSSNWRENGEQKHLMEMR